MKLFSPFMWATLLIVTAGIWLSTRKKEPVSSKSQSEIRAPAKATIADEIDVQPFVTEAGWGYVIYMKGKPYIRQDNIPVVEGNKGFSTREKALKAGQLVVYKIKHAILPPTVSKQELDSLQLLN
ncbi:DUF4907 domain-containing protein [Rhodocytophaga rosea]|uniref:DUF4907 domain-containing protein n=1 Tax=Rhodocytophaga rosea TaxID=2704465 RepID=A0A6C0GIQ5_9BACT|nr:DUF4907 domain-containing protein [Rhodocytophaga rosea]QHT67839.1 DUF4907 domain-containing protein [Rhodocytophaga rosea]